MKIAFLVNKFPLLSETFILNQITGLLDRGHQVHVYVRGVQREEKSHPEVMRRGLDAINLHQDDLAEADKLRLLFSTLFVALRRLDLLGACFRQLRPGGIRDALSRLYPLAAFIRRGPYDVVHAHYGANGNWAVELRAQGAFRCPIVTTFHDGFDLSTFLRRNGDDAYSRLFAEGELLLAISEHVRSRLLSLGAPESRTRVHRVGISIPQARAVPRTHLNPECPRIASVARLVPMKGIEFGLRAVALVAAEHPGLIYRIAGDGPLRAELELLSQSLGLEKYVIFLGWQTSDEIGVLLEDSDIFLAPSVTTSDGSQEGLPTVLMEAMASGLPVVSTSYSSIPELVTDGEHGYLLPERDTKGLADRLRDLLADPGEAAAMGHRASERAPKLHNIDVLNDRLVELYYEVIRGRTGFE